MLPEDCVLCQGDRAEVGQEQAGAQPAAERLKPCRQACTEACSPLLHMHAGLRKCPRNGPLTGTRHP